MELLIVISRPSLVFGNFPAFCLSKPYFETINTTQNLSTFYQQSINMAQISPTCYHITILKALSRITPSRILGFVT